jgi:hypothetical protein
VAVDLLPNVEALTVHYLLAHSDVSALVGQRVVTVLPNNPTFPLVRLFRIGGIPPLRKVLDEASLQVEAWADRKTQAYTLAATAQAALWDMAGVYAEGVVADVRSTLGLSYLPDPVLNEKPRYVFGVAVRARAL